MEAFTSILATINDSSLYHAALVFYGAYPVLMSITWICLSTMFRARTERSELPVQAGDTPFVSVIVPAFAEEETIARTLEAAVDLDYPAYEVIVVDDGSPDRTLELARRYLERGPVRILRKTVNEGKAMALNDALPLCRGEILVIVDADIIVTRDVLRLLARHFVHPRVAAVTGNPRVLNRSTFLQSLQTIEFSAIISMQRRAQRVWGRIMTVSGAVFAVRRSALVQVGGFSTGAATEDIDLTWKLQRRFWDVRYEPRAVVWMSVPPTLKELWKQRRRWAIGMAQVLKKNRGVLRHWKTRRLWPVYVESSASILWAYTFVGMTLYWIACKSVGFAALGASPFPNVWGMTIGTACLVQLFVGAWMDRRYDPHVVRSLPVSIFYPLVYWMLMAVITSIYSVVGLLKPPAPIQRWKIARSSA